MIDIGRICVKTAGRDAGKKCVVIDVLDQNYVLIDGETRRRKCNIMHLEPLDKTVDIKKNASHADVAKAFESLGWSSHAPKTKAKKPTRPVKARRSKLAAQPAAAKREARPAQEKKPAVKKPARAAASADQPTKSALPAAPKKTPAEKKA